MDVRESIRAVKPNGRRLTLFIAVAERENVNPDKIYTFTKKCLCMPLSYVIYGSLSIVAITIILYLFSKKKNR